MVVAWMTMPCRHDRLRQRRLLQPVKDPDCREITKCTAFLFPEASSKLRYQKIVVEAL